ncbi:MAG: 1-acyl-sn-glycerol-3-phosphate acyltransferase [Candidatus Marinimicrobia bacterium]|nr:1-acyl-sn-glycerol-3-phosphate acyltransferase [Candidatus Neomarinimicrobiota bacterium]
MLYRIAKFIAFQAVKLFYRRVIIKNKRYLPKSGPVIFAANHPNTMMDPLLIGFACTRNLHFLAKSTLFGRPLVNSFLNRLKIIPVYRRQDNPDDMHKNVEVFEQCYRILDQGKCILIFPEGISLVDRILSPIKTGAARIGFGAAARAEFQNTISIIPVGINYSDVVRFRSDVYIRFGQPITLSDYADLYQSDEVEAIHQVTNLIETALKKLTTSLKENELINIVENLESIYKSELIVDQGYEIRDKNDEFSVTKGLINAVEWFYEHQPERVENFKKLLNGYLENLKRLNLSDEFLSPVARDRNLRQRIFAFLYLVFGFPIYIYGLINNYLPYQVPRWYTNKYISAKEWYAPMKLITGAAVYIIYYGILITAMALISKNTWLTIGYSLTLIPSGNFVLKYLKHAGRYRQHWQFLNIFYRKRAIIFKIINQRMKLIQYLDNAKNEYLQWISKNESQEK